MLTITKINKAVFNVSFRVVSKLDKWQTNKTEKIFAIIDKAKH